MTTLIRATRIARDTCLLLALAGTLALGAIEAWASDWYGTTTCTTGIPPKCGEVTWLHGGPTVVVAAEPRMGEWVLVSPGNDTIEIGDGMVMNVPDATVMPSYRACKDMADGLNTGLPKPIAYCSQVGVP